MILFIRYYFTIKNEKYGMAIDVLSFMRHEKERHITNHVSWPRQTTKIETIFEEFH